ncbi:MAG: UDP-N-acetylmuramoyl-L-alanine--D-glutamate ligase [Lentisphaeria bacterium]|nr:UDP-N-acetylmuramoyl-L-alanine--D-glutamate ligase [Lentisphaeria bacterium]
MKKILMIGGGVSGQAVMALAEALQISCRIVSDSDDIADMNGSFDGVDLVVVSPGVLPTSRLYNEAVKRNIEVISELELGIRYFPGRLLAVTGTNGKTTTVELTGFLLNKLDIPAIAAGNIGLPLSAVSAAILRGETADGKNLTAVLEVSSFQLEHTSNLPAKGAVLLNVESDHINRYPGGLAEYRAVKERIFKDVAPENRFYGISMSKKNSCGIFALQDNVLYANGQVLLDLKQTAFAAEHNQENLMAALSLVSCLTDPGKALELLKNALCEFKTGDHRISLVAEKNGVKYIDDSKATNPAAVIAAVKSLSAAPAGNILLIAGGLDKDMDFSALAALSKYIKKVIVYGRCGSCVAEAFAGKNDVFDAGNDFALAVTEAHKAAGYGDIVLLSPAAASMDMFKDYKERGNCFAQLVKELL